ncbi:MAG TPA: tetratricopeptide repeat protein, partial [Myxococcota bacterium]
FFLLAILAHARATSARSRVLGSLAFTALALLAKPMAVTLPAVLVVVDVCFRARRDYARVVLEKLPHMALALAACIVTLQAQTHALVEVERYPYGARAENAIVAAAGYLEQTAWPWSLAVVYPTHPSGLPLLAVALSLALVLALLGLSLWLRGGVLGGVLWFFGMLVPVVGLVPVGQSPMDDRYTYLPHVGLFAALALLLARLSSRAPLVLAVLAMAIVPLTVRQIGFWQSALTLFTHAAEVAPGAVAHTELTRARLEVGDTHGAVEVALLAVQESPDNPAVMERLGLALYLDHQPEEAERALAATVEAFPDRKLAQGLLEKIRRERARVSP